MADGTKIEWSDATWNPIAGCDIISPGCINCYAMKLAGTRLKNHPTRAGLTRQTKAGPVWTGAVRFNDRALLDPLRWTRPRMIFVVAHGDLFAEAVPDAWIDQIFAVMALCPQHTFQILTKRPERMRAYLTRAAGAGRQDVRNHLAWEVTGQVMNLWHPDWRSEGIDGRHRSRAIAAFTAWPLPNVWLGVSVEDQKRADERIPALLDAPAALHWLSAEPMLGPLDLEPWLTWPDKLVEQPSGDYWGCIGCENAPCDNCPSRKAVYHCEVGPMGADGAPAYVSDERRTLGWIVVRRQQHPVPLQAVGKPSPVLRCARLLHAPLQQGRGRPAARRPAARRVSEGGRMTKPSRARATLVAFILPVIAVIAAVAFILWRVLA